MLIKVRVNPNSKKQSVVERGQAGAFTVSVREKAENGQANKGVVMALAEYFGISESQIRIIKGAKQRSKIFEIDLGDKMIL